MSHSKNSEDHVRADDRKQWSRALSTMMKQGRSFSGGERNCCYLNTGRGFLRPQASESSASALSSSTMDGWFANISAVSGLDHPDDGRAIAVADWDGDGDHDLWISNRNAPRLRLLRNDTPQQNHYLSILLQGNGTDTNRDAIGARVEVRLRQSESRRESEAGSSDPSHPNFPDGTRRLSLSKTLRAGEGFLAQSSKWLHFGLGGAGAIEKVFVRWPNEAGRGGHAEEFTGFAVDGRYQLLQGRGQPLPVARRNEVIALRSSTPDVPPPSRVARVPVITRYRFPKIKLRSAATGAVVVTGEGKPVLVNLWASWCTPCLKELAELRDRAADLRAAGIEVIAFSVDGLGDDRSDQAVTSATLKKIAFPFPSGPANNTLLEWLQAYHDTLVALQQPLPLPSSFLIDQEGRVAVIYKGRLNFEDLLGDINHSQGSLAERRERAAPIPGREIEHELVVDTARDVEATRHFRFANQKFDQGHVESAIDHFHEAIQLKPDFAKAHFGLGKAYYRQGKIKSAVSSCRRAVEIDPEDTAAHYLLASVYVAQRKLGEAKSCCTQVIRREPNHTSALFLSGWIFAQQDRWGDAVKYYRRVLEIDANHLPTLNELAWLLATHPSDQLRDGDEATQLATQLVTASGGKDPRFLSTLAAAQAEVGQFQAAVTTARKAMSLAQAVNQRQLLKQIAAGLDLYNRAKPYRTGAQSTN